MSATEAATSSRRSRDGLSVRTAAATSSRVSRNRSTVLEIVAV
jgi:hypothetical protein